MTVAVVIILWAQFTGEEVNNVANQEHLRMLKQRIFVWNKWRQQYPEIQPDLSEADLKVSSLSYANLSGANLSSADLSRAKLNKANLNNACLKGANLSGAKLSRVDLSGADLREAKLSGAKLSRVDLSGADLREAKLSGANLSGADLREANLSRADLREAILNKINMSKAILNGSNLSGVDLREANLSYANLSGVDLSQSTLIGTNFQQAILNECRIYGISAWDMHLEAAQQLNLIITPKNQPTVTVDNLQVAQFIYLLLNSKEIRDVIDTITSKTVLILDRFTFERKMVLDAVKDKLREYNYLPILFDFEKPISQTITETISTLAHLARFIIVDLTDPRSVPAELATIVPHCFVPVQPLLEVPSVFVEEDATGKHVVEENTVEGKEYALFRSLQLYPWVLPIVHYQDTVELLSSLKEHVIDPAEQKAQELARQK